MKYTHAGEWIYKIDEEVLSVTYSFDDMMDDSDSLSAVTITALNHNASDIAASMITNKVVNATYVTFSVKGGAQDSTYEIRIKGSTAGSEEIFTSHLMCEVFGGLVLNTKVADSGQNSYLSLQEANQKIRSQFGHSSLWDSLTQEGRKRVLIQSAKDFNQFNYVNKRYYDNQGLEFPRSDHKVVSGAIATPITTTSFKQTSAYSTSYMSYPNTFWKYGSVHITTGTPIRETRVISNSLASDGTITVASAFSATPSDSCTVKIFAPISDEIKTAQVLQTLHILSNTGDETLYNLRNAGVSRYKIGDVETDFNTKSLSNTSISSEAKRLLSRHLRKTLRVGRG